MGTEIRPELSDKNPYWIGKHRYYELKHFCLQYPIWKKAYAALDGLSKRPQDLEVFVKSGQLTSDPTARCAESRLFFADRMELVEQAEKCQKVVEGAEQAIRDPEAIFGESDSGVNQYISQVLTPAQEDQDKVPQILNSSEEEQKKQKENIQKAEQMIQQMNEEKEE